MRDDWTFEDRDRLLAKTIVERNDALIGRVLWSDSFEPSLGLDGGIGDLINITPTEKKAERERVVTLYKERAAIKARWASADA